MTIQEAGDLLELVKRYARACVTESHINKDRMTIDEQSSLRERTTEIYREIVGKVYDYALESK